MTTCWPPITTASVQPARDAAQVPKGAAAELLRRDDDDRVLDARRAHRTRRSDVPHHAGPAQQPRPRHGALDILPAATHRSAATGPGRRGRAPTGPEPLWNESWYWDFADPGSGASGMDPAGFGAQPDLAWINALICGPDMPTVALLDFHALFPDDPNDVHGDGVELRHAATVPLRSTASRSADRHRSTTTRQGAPARQGPAGRRS